ncbi:MAG TPA: ATP-binding protein [bacterium]|nr:ATP-binding protein [bacterium]
MPNKVKKKILFLIILIASILLSSLFLLKLTYRYKFKEYSKKEYEKNYELFDRLFDLKNSSSNLLCSDYTYWTEMADFTKKPDKVWAENNLNTALESFKLNFLYVFDETESQKHFIKNIPDSEIDFNSLNFTKTFFNKIKEKKFPEIYYFANSGKLVQLCVSTIHKTEDVERKNNIFGFFAAGKIIDDSFLKEIRQITKANIFLNFNSGIENETSKSGLEANEEGIIFLKKILYGYDNKPVAAINAEFKIKEIQIFNELFARIFIIQLITGLILLALLFYYMKKWIWKPLSLLRDLLSDFSTEKSKILKGANDEFGMIARLIDKYFSGRRLLEQTQDSLKKSESNLRSVLENTPDIILRLDCGMKILFANENVFYLTNNADSPVGKKISESGMTPEFAELLEENLISSFCDKKNKEIEITLERADLTKIFNCRIIYECKHYDDKLMDSAVCILRDITALKNLEMELIRSERLTAVGQFSAGIAHEFNNILTIIKMNAEYMELEIGDNNEYRKLLETISEQTNRGREIAVKMMQFSKPGQPSKMNYDLSPIIEEAYIFQKTELLKENIVFEKDVENDPELFIFCDKNQIIQVLLNLFINARHAIKPNKKGRIRISAKKENENVIIKFIDDGIGMNKTTITKIFTPFFSTKGAYDKTNSGIKGSGLGLSICMSIIKQHNGKIEVKSEEGKGTEFIIRLPYKPSE